MDPSPVPPRGYLSLLFIHNLQAIRDGATPFLYWTIRYLGFILFSPPLAPYGLEAPPLRWIPAQPPHQGRSIGARCATPP